MSGKVSGAKSRQAPLAMAGLALAGVARFLAEVPAVVEWHRTWFFPRIASLLQALSGGVAATIGELGAGVVLALALGLLVTRRAGAIGAVVFATGFAVFTFYASWGFAYRYPPLGERLASIPPSDEAGATQRLVDLTRRSAMLLARASKGGLSFAGADAEFLARVNASLDEGFSSWPAEFEASPIRGVPFGPAKASRVSFVLSRLQISGYYFPWSGEAQIDAEMPRSLWPRVSGHEKAHQRGFARENEATVIGTITCLRSNDPTVFYGGALGLFVAFDRELARVDQSARRGIWAGLPAPVVEHLRVEAAFWKSHEGVAGKVSEKVNDTYLKAQGVKSGVLSYAETTRLLLMALETPGLDLGRLLQAEGAAPEVTATPTAPIR